MTTPAARAERALVESEEFARLIIDSAADYAILTLDLDLQITSWSPGATAIFGWAEAEVLGKRVEMLSGAVDVAAAAPLAEFEGARTDGYVAVERWHARKDGERFFAAGSIRPLHTADGVLRGYLKVVRDETARREAELELERSEAFLNAVLESLPVGVAIADAEGGVLRTNAAYRDVWRFVPEASNWRQYTAWVGFSPDDGHRLDVGEWPMSRALRDREVVTQELVEIQPFGSEERRCILNNAGPVLDAEGQLLGGVVAQLDVTEERATARALRDADERYRLAALATNDAIWDWDPRTDRTVRNEGFHKLFGYPLETMHGELDWWRDRVHPDDLPTVEALIAATIESPQDGWACEYRFRRADGNYAHVFDRGYVQRDEDGRAVRLIGAMQDITERKALEARLRQAIDDEATLVREIHHRVKNSLQLVSGLLSVQAKGAPQAVRNALNDAQARISAIAGIHDRLWRQEEAEWVDLQDLLIDLVERLASTVQGFTVTCEASPARMRTDQAVSLGLLVTEAVTNAFKYAYPGGGGPVDVRLEPLGDDELRLTVEDRGRGLPAEGKRGPSLGTRLMNGVARQLGGRLQIQDAQPGVRVVLAIPAETDGRSEIGGGHHA